MHSLNSSRTVPRSLQWLSFLVVLGFGAMYALRIPLWPSFVLWLVGLICGWGGWYLDQQNSQKWYQAPPITNSLLFWLAAIPAAIFVVTSTPYWLGKGLVMGWLTTTVVLVWAHAKNEHDFHHLFLHQLQRQLSAVELRMVVAIISAVWLVLAIGSWV